MRRAARKLTRRTNRRAARSGSFCRCWYCWPAPTDRREARAAVDLRMAVTEALDEAAYERAMPRTLREQVAARFVPNRRVTRHVLRALYRDLRPVRWVRR